MSALVRVSEKQGVLRIALDRPEVRNALSAELAAQLTGALEAGAENPAVRAVVLSGEGPDFCAGADLGDMKKLGAASPEENRADAERLGRLFRTQYRFPRPVVARVHGNVFGGGCGLVAASDIAIVERGARFAFSEVRLGILPAVIGPYVVRRVGDAWTRRLFLTGERFDAERAVAIGLCTRVAEEGELDDAVSETLDLLLRGSPDAQRRIKELLEVAQAGSVDDAARQTPVFIADARASAEGQEGLQAFFEKRKASWVRGGRETAR